MSRDPITGREELVSLPTILGSDAGALTVKDLFGETSEFAQLELTYVGNRAFLTGDAITDSGARGSSILKLAGTLSMASGAFEGIDIKLATSGAFTAAGAGVLGLKAVVTNTAHLTDGNIYGGQFIAKHAHATNHMHAEACLIGLEAIGYVSSDAEARTVVGLNAVVRSYALAEPAGTCIRAVQVILDVLTRDAGEVSAMCVWNMGGTVVNQVLNLVGGAFTHFVLFTDDGTPAQSTSTTVTNAGTKGWIKVKVGTATRYIALCDGVT